MKFSIIYFLLYVLLFIQLFADCWRTRIIGGNDVTDVNQYPWMAQLLVWGEFSCGGSLINSKYVLTAAHCVKNERKSDLSIRLMKLYLTGRNKNTTITTNVNRVLIHPNYNSRNVNNDIALLRLDRDVKVGNKAGYPRPISLPPKGKSFNRRNGIVMGWGLTEYEGEISDVLREVQITVISNEECRQLSGYYDITPNMLCAGHLGGGRDACQGDSGGPLVIGSNSKYYIIGIVSWGRKCGMKNAPGVYTRVNQYLPWILKNIAGS